MNVIHTGYISVNDLEEIENELLDLHISYDTRVTNEESKDLILEYTKEVNNYLVSKNFINKALLFVDNYLLYEV